MSEIFSFESKIFMLYYLYLITVFRIVFVSITSSYIDIFKIEFKRIIFNRDFMLKLKY